MARLVLPYFSFIVFLLLMCIATQPGTGTTHSDEVKALLDIAEQLGKKDWNTNVDPCINESSWLTPKLDSRPLYDNSLFCNCSYPDGVCHVVALILKGQDLGGVLPRSLVNLSYLTYLDLNRNFLSGNIPHEWASTKLEFLSLSVNNLSGPIPSFLGNITTLRNLTIESNLFSGTVPHELGNLVNLESLVLNANNLTGELPVALTNLTKLKLLRISSNNFTGRMPDFFRSWKLLQKLEIQASGFEGPIPSSISILSNLTELRISDLVGEGSKFSNLSSMKGMNRLMLKSCNITGSIPSYISDMKEIQILDLSFNRLEGSVPDLSGLEKLQFMYLTSNLLNGPIPEWIKDSGNRLQLDLSYNSFSESYDPACGDSFKNLFKSSSGRDNLILGECLKNVPCSKDRYSMHINCGGNAITIGNITYEADKDLGGSARYFHENENWGFSGTGHFWDLDTTLYDYIANNVSILTMNESELYTSARLSPLSFTYYARCLAKGTYKVKLHFAEIVIRDNRSFYSLGRRIFDIYVQEKLVWKDFDIDSSAIGVDKAVVKEHKANVTDNVLMIRFYWAGKGTTAAPKRGTYGPLISAISVESGLKELDLQTGFFTYRQIKAATNNFNAANKIGEGGFGSVFKGILLDGTVIAVKQLSPKSKQGSREFVNEIGMISGLQHPNLVRLYGCCIEGKHLLLIYEYMENNSVAHTLFGPADGRLKLDWPARQKICVGIARGLAFLHEESTLKVVHRDIKTTNVLLDRDLNPKISDFGLAKLNEEENTHISTRIAGTIGYMAPEYALRGYLTDKADVFSFGVVALEIVAGKNNMKYQPNENFVCLLDKAIVLQQKGNLMELVDPELGSEFSKKEVIRMIKVALLCTNPSPAPRPTMTAVVSMLEGGTVVDELNIDPSIYGNNEWRFEGLRNQLGKSPQPSSRESQSLAQSSNATWMCSSTSV
ncbi:probable LRR receptor-like serine/threonine-protein kinase At1g07650 isoform X2 [Quercus lobata]|uniref:probable LRR receptor-like serine/threonine-protein kinase At1g07650 isoform X2 n=1 Tax=Quercus lobata TaxID=97700 RepID=UPI00124854D4|nr:probable LRR receptor-like serine/threonine-protein kinase At1g07650 isoform X2 [Quercus lobata]